MVVSARFAAATAVVLAAFVNVYKDFSATPRVDGVPVAVVAPIPDGGKAAAERARRDAAFAALKQFAGWTGWNSFTHHVRVADATGAAARCAAREPAELCPGQVVDFRVSMRQAPELPLRFIVLEVDDEDTRICWSYQMVPPPLQPFILTTRRCMELRVSPDGRHVLLDQWDTNSGPLAPLVVRLFGSRIEEGFARMANDLKAHLE